jgi:hypothetical protein
MFMAGIREENARLTAIKKKKKKKKKNVLSLASGQALSLKFNLYIH